MKHTPKIFTAILLAINVMPVCAVAEKFKIPDNEIPKEISGLKSCDSTAKEAFYCAVRERTEGKKPNVCSGSEIHRKFPSYTKLVIDELEKRNIPNNDLENSWNLRDELLPKVEQACKDYLKELTQAMQSSQTAPVNESAEKTEPVYQTEPVNKKETETLPVYQTQSETRATETTPVSVDKTPTKPTTATLITVSGKVTNKETGKGVEDVVIQAIKDNKEQTFTMTNSDGSFVLKGVPSDAVIFASNPNYKKFTNDAKSQMNIELSPLNTQIQEVVISGKCPPSYIGGVEWSDAENACVCKDKNQQLINGVCVDKPQRTSSLEAQTISTESTKDKQTVMTELNDAIANGVKIGDRIQIDKSIRYDPDIEKLVNKWENACKKAIKPAHAKTSFAFVVNHLDLIRECKIKDCEKGYEVSENGLSCETESDKIKACEEKGGKYSAGSCWCKTMIMNPSKAECIDGKIVKDKQSKKDKKDKTGKECGQSEKLKNGKCVEIDDDTDDAENSTYTNGYDNSQTSENEADPERLAKLRQAYDDARETEQSHENRLLTTGATVATGIGGMELAKGLSEQNADKTAEQSMASYIATMRCKYGNGKQVKVGLEEIELPGGNDAQMMQLRAEYIALANDLKTRKEALGMRPGIESEKILDKSQIGLYDDENIGITDGAYASLYRAQMYGTQKDQEQIDKNAETSKNRVIGGAVAGGVGAVGGTLGDSLINGKLNELIQSNKDK